MTVLTDENLDNFTVTFRQEVLFYLRQLIADSTPVSVSFNEGRETLLTVLLHLDDAAGQLLVDWGGSEECNRHFLQAERSIFVALPHGVRHQFVAGKARAVEFNGRRAFSVAIPKQFVRLQRREFFRLSLPITQRPGLILPDSAAKTGAIAIVDIGLGGIGMEVPALPPEWDTDHLINKALIDLGRFGPVVASMRLRHIEPVLRGQRQMFRVGSRFEGLSHTQEVEMQRFISHVQREERAKLG